MEAARRARPRWRFVAASRPPPRRAEACGASRAGPLNRRNHGSANAARYTWWSGGACGDDSSTAEPLLLLMAELLIASGKPCARAVRGVRPPLHAISAARPLALYRRAAGCSVAPWVTRRARGRPARGPSRRAIPPTTAATGCALRALPTMAGTGATNLGRGGRGSAVTAELISRFPADPRRPRVASRGFRLRRRNARGPPDSRDSAAIFIWYQFPRIDANGPRQRTGGRAFWMGKDGAVRAGGDPARRQPPAPIWLALGT